MVTVAPELLVAVTSMGLLVVPTVCAGNVKLIGDKVTGTTALPLRSTICGLPAPEVATATDPLTVPGMDGLNVTAIVHLAPAARGPPQGVPPLPAAAKFPLAVRELMVTALPLVLVTVTVFAALVAPTPVALKLAVAGLNFSGTTGPPVPFPESATTCGLSAPLSAM